MPPLYPGAGLFTIVGCLGVDPENGVADPRESLTCACAGLDPLHKQARHALAVPAEPALVLLGLVMEHSYPRAAALRQHAADDLRIRDQRRAYSHARIVSDQKHPLDLHPLAGSLRQLFNVEYRLLLNPILLSTALEDCVHEFAPKVR
jgi:hypothetical protein